MKASHPDTLETAKLDLEIDFEDRGGLQRFKTIEDLRVWIAGEREFWKWLDQEPARSRRQQLGPAWEHFWRFDGNVQNEINRQSQRWTQLAQERKQLQDSIANAAPAEQEKLSAKDRVEAVETELGTILDHLRGTLHSHIHSDVFQRKFHLLQSEPEAHFVAEIAATDMEAATFALGYFLSRDQQQNGEFKGRMLAALFTENLNRKVRPDQAAFNNAITTWTRELEDFKGRYEAKESEFADLSQKHLDAEDSWKKRHDQLAEDFGTMRLAAEKDLKNLKDTYETHMQLHGPLTYWKGKRKEHAKGKIVMGWLSGIAGVIGLVGLLIAASFMLPAEQSPDKIPWRNLGFFVLTTTFVLWFVRLLVKLLLSHIHLYADAKEREVMISTFMALIRRPESAQNLKREDIAIVLAPIFKPSTTGVIKDDGGPTSLGDFISRLSGK